MPEQLEVKVRDKHGKRRVRRMRRAGHIPAILYGHGGENISLSIAEPDIGTVIRHRNRLVELKGATEETALIREVKWDPFGIDVLHIDLLRVSADERVQTIISVELRGEAPGVSEGGVVELLVREVGVECAVAEIPEKLELNINSLKLGESLTAAHLPLSEGADLLVKPETIVVQCIEPAIEAEGEEGLPMEAAEPEVIGRKEESDAEASD